MDDRTRTQHGTTGTERSIYFEYIILAAHQEHHEHQDKSWISIPITKKRKEKTDNIRYLFRYLIYRSFCSVYICIPYRIRRCIYLSHPPAPGPIFHARYIDTWNGAVAKKLGVGSISPRVFRRRIVRCRHRWHYCRRAIRDSKTAPGGCHV